MDRTIRALVELSAVDGQLSQRDKPIGGDVLALEARRAALREAIPRDFLATYDDLGRIGRRPVVVEVRGAHCSGCYLRLPPRLGSLIGQRQSLCACPHCRRLLYTSPPAGEGGDENESTDRDRNRFPADRKTSKPARRLAGGGSPRQEAKASKAQGSRGRGAPRARDAYAAGARRGKVGSAGTASRQAKPIER